MDTNRRRQLRRKYMDEEERLSQAHRGRPYEMGENDFDMDLNEPAANYDPKLPKYKARTFKNILREFDDPDFDERQNYLQEYKREEIEEPSEEVQELPQEEEEIFAEEETEELEEQYEEQIDEEEDYEPYSEPSEPAEEEEARYDFPSDYEPQPIRRKKTLRQMEREEIERRGGVRTTHRSYENLQKPTAPRPIRIIAFVAFMILSFVLGYYICGGVFRLTNFSPTTTEEQASTTTASQQQTVASQTTGVTNPATIFVPKDGSIVSTTIEQKGASSNEQMLKGVLSSCLTGIKEAGLLSLETELSELWISQDTLNLSFNQKFVTDMTKLKSQDAALVLRSILRTANTNLPRVRKLKIYSDLSPVTLTSPLDFTKPWENM